MTPPRLASRLVAWLAGRDNAPFVLSDLHEEFVQLSHVKGPAAASRWYWRQVVTSILPLIGVSSGRLPRFTVGHVRESVRVFRHSPGLSLAVVTTLALGIGANTAVFSVVDAVLLRPLPYPDAERLFSLWEANPTTPRLTVSAANLVDYRRGVEGHASLAAFNRATVVMGTGGEAEEVPIERVSWNLPAVLGVGPAYGRTFTPADAEAGGDPVAIVSHRFWQQRLGATLSVLGTTVIVDKVPRRIVGILPPDARPLSDYTAAAEATMLLPLVAGGDDSSRGDRNLRVIGRLESDASLSQVQQRLDRVRADLAHDFPSTNAQIAIGTAPLSQDLTRNVRPTLLLVSGAVALIGLIACVNVANLLLVWATGHRRDAAIRLALGASRGDLVMAHLTRGLVFGVVGGLVGLVCSVWVRDALISLAPATVIPQVGQITLSARVFVVSGAMALIAGVLASVVPAWQFGGRNVSPVLTESSLSVVGTRSVMRWRGALLLAEVAAAVVLALGAGLLVRSVVLLDRVDLGFATDRVVTMAVRLSPLRYDDGDARLRFFETLVDQIRTIPGVAAATFANQFPLRGGWSGRLQIIGPSGPVEGEADLQAVSAEYFDTLGLTVRRGRALTRTDRTGAPAAVVVSELFVQRYLDGREPLGAVIRRNADSPPLTIVGIVADIRRDGKFEAASPQVYISAYQPDLYAASLGAVAVRAVGDPQAAMPQIRAAVAAIDPTAVVSGVRTLDDILHASVATLRFHTFLLAVLAGLAMVLTLIGVYGVVNYVVAQRTREIGLRIALGATRAHVIRGAVGAGLRWVAAGVVVGAAAAAGMTQVLASLLFETTPHEPVTFLLVAAVVAAVGAIAAYLPARRAADADPVSALRGD